MRLLRTGALDPALNLALDEALLRAGEETLRLYRWAPPGLSLGFFQKAADFDVPPGFVLVRRPTGGGAIAHAGELTLSWVGRRRRVEEAYDAINAVVLAAAERLGVRNAGRGTEEPEAAPAGLCFDAHTRYDLVAGGRKFFGSAQRRGGDRFLLHGSLVLAPNPWAAGAVSLQELSGRPVPYPEAEGRVVEAAEELWGVRFMAAQPSPEEWEAAGRLVERRYGNEAWTRRR